MKKIEGEFLVLPEYVKRKDFLDLAHTQEWKLLKTYPGDSKSKPSDEVWVTKDNKNAIHFVDDPIVGMKYVWISGPELRKLMFHAYRRLAAYDPEDLIKDAYEEMSHNETVDTLFRIAVAFPNYSPEALQVFSTYFNYPEPLIRKATIQAIGYRMWDESIELLNKFAESDPDQEVRSFAKEILADTERKG